MTSTQRARLILLLAVLISVVLALVAWWWPTWRWLNWPVMFIGTLAHELGHGLAALLLGGNFESLKLYADGSGVALTRSPARAGIQAAIAAGGLLGTPLVAMGLFAAATRPRVARWTLWIVSAFLLFALVCWVRNPLGFLGVMLCISIAGLGAWRLSALGAQVMVAVVAVQLCWNSLLRLDYLFMKVAQTGAGEWHSDTQQMALLLGGTYWLWGIVVAVISLLTLLAGIVFFLRALRS